jgi:hypothetical protein
VKKIFLTFLSLVSCSVSLYGSKDQPCHETFQLKAEPIERVYAKGEPIIIRLSFTNSTSHDVYIVPYLFPSDYWVATHRDGRWINLSTGIGGPNAKERPAGLTGPTRPSDEYRRIQAGEMFTKDFGVDLSRITKSPGGKFLLGSVHAHIHANDSAPSDYGCFISAPQSAVFTVR